MKQKHSHYGADSIVVAVCAAAVSEVVAAVPACSALVLSSAPVVVIGKLCPSGERYPNTIAPEHLYGVAAHVRTVGGVAVGLRPVGDSLVGQVIPALRSGNAWSVTITPCIMHCVMPYLLPTLK